MADCQVVIQQFDEISICVEQGLIMLEQKDAVANESHCIAFPVLYANQVIKAIKAAAKQ